MCKQGGKNPGGGDLLVRVHIFVSLCVCVKSEGEELNHVTKRSSADCSLRALALTTGPAVRLHPSDASDSLYGSRPKATAHEGLMHYEIFTLVYVILY